MHIMLFERYRNKTKPQSEKKKSNLAYAFFKRFPNFTPNKKKIPEQHVETQPRTSMSLPNIPATLTTFTTSNSTPHPKASIKQRKRHSAEQRRRRHHLITITNRHSITFGHFPHLSPLTKAELSLDPSHLTKLNKLVDLPDNTTYLLDKLGKPPILLPHRSISHPIQPQLSQAYSESHTNHRATPLDPTQLVDLHSTAMLIDVRNVLDFQKRRIRGSMNVHLPSLLIKRYQRRGTVSNFNLENFITMGRDMYVQKNTYIVYDDTMEDPASQAWTLLSLLSSKSNNVFYLRGGFNSFHLHDWIDTSAADMTVILPRRSVSYTIGESRLFHLDTTHKPQKPIEETTFVISEIIPGFLYVGPEIETPEHADQLHARQIKRVLNMAEECHDEGLAKQTILYQKISARDTVEMKNIELVMMEAVHFIGKKPKVAIVFITHSIRGGEKIS
jgi:rhodanese-related sulfurtransferase